MIRYLLILLVSFFHPHSFEFEGFELFSQSEWSYVGDGKGVLNPEIYKYSAIIETVYRIQAEDCFVYIYHMKESDIQAFSLTLKKVVAVLGKESVTNVQRGKSLSKLSKKGDLQNYAEILESGGTITKSWARSIPKYGVYLIWTKGDLELVLKPT